MRRPSLTDLYAGRPGSLPKRRNRVSEALLGAAKGVGQGLAFGEQDDKSGSVKDDQSDVLPGTALSIEITEGLQNARPSSPPQRRLMESGRPAQNQVSRRTIDSGIMPTEDGSDWKDFLARLPTHGALGALGGGEGLTSGLIPRLLRELLGGDRQGTSKTDSLA